MAVNGVETLRRIAEMKKGPLARLEARCAGVKGTAAALGMVDELLSDSTERGLSLLVLVACKLAHGFCEQVIERPGGEIASHYEEEACDYALQFTEFALQLESGRHDDEEAVRYGLLDDSEGTGELGNAEADQ